jgi:hypothetical protein
VIRGTSEKTDLLDHDDFGSPNEGLPLLGIFRFKSGKPDLNQSKIMNVIDSKDLERDAGAKPPTLLLIPL